VLSCPFYGVTPLRLVVVVVLDAVRRVADAKHLQNPDMFKARMPMMATRSSALD